MYVCVCSLTWFSCIEFFGVSHRLTKVMKELVVYNKYPDISTKYL